MCSGIASQRKFDSLGMWAVPIMSVSEMTEVMAKIGEENDQGLYEN